MIKAQTSLSHVHHTLPTFPHFDENICAYVYVRVWFSMCVCEIERERESLGDMQVSSECI